MEHQLLPRGASYGQEDSVPYIAKTDYLKVAFLEYPKFAGHTFLTGEGKSFWISDIQLMKESPSPEFLQTWLFFGLFDEVLGRSLDKFLGISLYNHSDFVQVCDSTILLQDRQGDTPETASSTSSQSVLNTAKLSGLLAQWFQLIRPKLDDAEPLFTHLRICIVSVAGYVLDYIVSIENDQLKQCLCSIIELLGLALEDVFSKASYAKNENCIPAVSESILTGKKIEHMTSRGWCPFQATALTKSYQYMQCWLYFERLDRYQRSSQKDRHRDCTNLQCQGLLPPNGPQHRQSDCQCDEVKLKTKDWELVRLALNSQRVPILSLHDTNGTVEMEIIISNPNYKYCALSHVWADGLCNNIDNSLMRCQIDYIYHCLKSLQTTRGYYQSNVYVWIDTICCPLEPDLQVKALGLMGKTYRDAGVILVLDSELETTDCTLLDHLEIISRIACSTWIRRLWTLQESLLAQNVWVQFQLKALNLDGIMAEHSKIDSRINIKMLHQSVRSKILGIRRKQIHKDLSATQTVHIIGKGIEDRFVTVSSDEPLCLTTVFDLDLSKVAKKAPEQRMQEYWRLMSESKIQIPLPVVFSGCPRLLTAGYRWAPSTIIDPETPHLLSIQTGAGKICDEGLKVNLPGVLLSAIAASTKLRKAAPDGPTDRPTFFREQTGAWYAFSMEDDYEAKKIAKRTNTSYMQVMTQMESDVKDSLPEKYSKYAIIGSQPRNRQITGSSKAILVSIREKKDGIIFVNLIHCVLTPCLINPSLSRILEAAYKHVSEMDTGAEELYDFPRPGTEGANKLGQRILDDNPGLLEHLHNFGCSSAYLRELVELMLKGRFAAQGEVLDSSQQWCID